LNDLNAYRHIHFVGIGGAGMSAIASVLLGRGFDVSGSDRSESRTTWNLARGGATIYLGHAAANIEGADLIVVSTAIAKDNPERLAAERSGKPVWHRADALAAIMREGKSIAVSGTHGKTTTTTMMGFALLHAGMDPTVLVGAEVREFGGNALTGRGLWTVAEADESDGSFLGMSPNRIIITNVEADHLDYYRDLNHVVETFESFLAKMPADGRVVACLDSPPVAEILKRSGRAAVTYALHHPGADLIARDIRRMTDGAMTAYDAVFKGETLGRVRLRLPGDHNVANSLAVIAAGLDIGCSFESLAASLAQCQGACRRFEFKGDAGGIAVFDDYAHHPTEVRATLDAARHSGVIRPGGRLVAVFQPHRYTRTACFAREFGPAFGDADLTVITPVYSAGETAIEGVSGETIVESALASGQSNVRYIPAEIELQTFLDSELREGDLLLTLGAGDVYRSGESFLARHAHGRPGSNGHASAWPAAGH
jgi:UDP-N-acetylmuramate--alanine ligase